MLSFLLVVLLVLVLYVLVLVLVPEAQDNKKRRETIWIPIIVTRS